MELVGSVVKKNIDEFCLCQFYVNENNVMNTKYINPIKKINLHLHTSVSDGALAPRALIERSRAIGLDLISITDHDTTDAYRLIGEADLGLRLLPGIEISSQHEGNDVHILAYGYDIDAPGLNELTEMYLIGRRDRAVKMLDKLSKLGMDIALDEVVAVAGSRELIVRPHIAQVMVAKGYCATKNEAFEKFIGNFKPAYYPKPEVSVEDSLKVIHDAGAWAVIAHPGKLTDPSYLDLFIEMGIDGIEVWHPDHSSAQVRDFNAKALKNNLLMTAGSDFHGEQDRHNLMDIVPASAEVIDSVNFMWSEYSCRKL